MRPRDKNSVGYFFPLYGGEKGKKGGEKRKNWERGPILNLQNRFSFVRQKENNTLSLCLSGIDLYKEFHLLSVQELDSGGGGASSPSEMIFHGGTYFFSFFLSSLPQNDDVATDTRRLFTLSGTQKR